MKSKPLDDNTLLEGSRRAGIMSKFYARINGVHKKPLHPGQIQIAKDYFQSTKRIIMSQWGRSCGKALAIDTPILTTGGWRCMGDLQVGDFVFGPDGAPTQITAVSPIMYDRVCYDVVFSDGSTITADAEHLWETYTKLNRRSLKKNRGRMLGRSPVQKASVKTTEEIRATLLHGKEANHTIPLTAPIEFPRQPLPVDPYVLGAWLGDGSSSNAAIYSDDLEIIDNIRARGHEVVKTKCDFRYAIRGLFSDLRKLSLIRNKHIPQQYFFSSPEQRLALLQGLLDTDGCCNKNGSIEFSNCNEQIALGVKFLAESLGAKVTVATRFPKCQGGRVGAKSWRVCISTTQQVFRLSRKLRNLKAKKRAEGHRFIWEVRERPSVPVRCIRIDNDSHLFLAGKSLIPTHNTETALYIACVAAALNDNFIIYIITPERKQGKEIYWASKRLQNYPPPELVETELNSEIRLLFKNGSFICVDGCENYNAHRGLKPNLVIYDEFQNHNREFHMEVMAPNLLAKNSSLIIFGTPPKSRAAFYVEFHDQLTRQIKKGDDTRSYYEFRTELNPSIDKLELAKVRKELFDSGNEVIWYREYEGKMAFGGEDVVFPKWNPNVHVRSHRVVMSYLEGDRTKLKWFTICDPGTSTCFAVLFAAYNPYTQQIFILDEIYEKDRNRTDTRQMWERILRKEQELYPGAPDRAWRRFYDEAAAWFQREVSANFRVGLIPTQKQKTDEEQEISKVKMLMAQPGALSVSDRCYWFRWEIESYVTDKDGKLPDRNNHLLDCGKYLMNATGWKLMEKGEQDLIPVVSKQNNVAIPIENWADNIVEASLETKASDIYDGFFD
jgi:hypothetical protein